MAIDEAKLNELPGRSDVGTTAPPQPPIGPYRRLPVQSTGRPGRPEVARRLIALIATRWPATPAEHVGSTAVPGLAGKGIIDLLLPAEPADIPAITAPYTNSASSPSVRRRSRPPGRCCGAPSATEPPSTGSTCTWSQPTIPRSPRMRGLRDALGADPFLRRRYAALKRAIVAGGPADPVAFTKAKHDWIAATLAHLGLADQQPRRLYQDDLNPDNPDQLAS